ncbi:hypothetical protein ACN47E_007189 [Coniothyrium glycines]
MPAARLERLRELVQVHVDALPDRAVTPQAEVSTGSDSDGGVPLDPQLQPNDNHFTPLGTDHDSNTAPPSNADLSDQWAAWLDNIESSNTTNLETKQQPTAAPTASSAPVTGLQQGHLTAPDQLFTPIQALARYPYKFCDKTHMQDIASIFFDAGKFWEREWSLYYVWDIELAKPLILVGEAQVQELLTEINIHLGLDLRITDQQREEGLLVSFPDHPRCLPRYLGPSHSREEYNNMVNNAPSESFRAAGEKPAPDLQPPTLEEFKQLMEDLWELQKAKTKAGKVKKHQERLVKQKTMVDQFKRTQRYLGLRPAVVEGTSTTTPPLAIDPSSPAPYECDRSVVFVCVDVESYERAHHKITEVGVATLDTRDLIGVAPGVDGEVWRKQIRARHFRINEHKHLRNGTFVSDHADGFLFGESTFVPLAQAAQHVAACFHAPFGAHHSNNAGRAAPTLLDIDITEKRNIIFLGHDTLSDVRYLQQLGYDPLKVENIVEALDTASMYKVWRREQQSTSLGRILNDFDIVGWRLHNAGNDAAYTVQAMLGICVREATIRGSNELIDMREDQKATREATALEEVQQRIKDDADGWSDQEADGDGGAPVPLATSAQSKSAPGQTKLRLVPQYDNGLYDHSQNHRGGQGRGGGRGHYSKEYQQWGAQRVQRGPDQPHDRVVVRGWDSQGAMTHDAAQAENQGGLQNSDAQATNLGSQAHFYW